MITIWHNPRCTKSRQTVALLESHGHKFTIRPYLNDAPTVDELRVALTALGTNAIDMMRPNDPLFKELGLSNDGDDKTLIAVMADHPALIERPIVFAKGRAAIGRPPKAVLDIL